MKKRNQEKQKGHFIKTWNRLIKYSRKYVGFVVVSLIAIVFATTIQIYSPNIIRDLTNEIIKLLPVPVGEGIKTLETITKIGVTLIILYSISMVLNTIQSYIMSVVTQKVTFNLRNDLSSKTNRLPLNFFDTNSIGDTISRVINDADIVGQTLNQSIATLVSSIIMVLGSLIMMFISNWILALTSISASLIGFVLMGVIMAKSQKYFVEQQKNLGELNGNIEEVYENHNVIQAYNGGKQTVKDFNVVNKKIYTSAWKSEFISGFMMPLMSFVGNLGYVFVAVVGGLLFANGTIDFGVITAFLIYVRLFTNALGQLAQGTSSMQRTVAASKRIFEFLDNNELSDESHITETIVDAKGDVEFLDVEFGYLEDKKVINNFNAKIKAGQKVAIVGPTGAGKTTIVNLLMRFYEVNAGKILIDGVDTKALTRENVHDQFCMVLQDTWMFEGTILDNIRYSKKDVSDTDIINACKRLGLHHFISTLSEGYQTILTSKSSLSEGQKQLITIARAMIKNAPLLILDEATSSVDTRTEILIQNAMDELMKGRTSFVIAHRLSTIKNADLILVMKHGDIVEKGNHEELLEAKGFYSELYNSQFEEYK